LLAVLIVEKVFIGTSLLIGRDVFLWIKLKEYEDGLEKKKVKER